MQSQMELMELRELMKKYSTYTWRGRLAGSAPNSDTRSTMVSLMGGNEGDDKGWDDKVISTAMEVGSGNTGDGKDM